MPTPPTSNLHPSNLPAIAATLSIVNIGPIQLDKPFMQAGLAGYSDRAMRVVARRRGCPYAVTEALLDTILLQGGKGLANSIDINEEDHPCAGQIIGSEPETMELNESSLTRIVWLTMTRARP